MQIGQILQLLCNETKNENITTLVMQAKDLFLVTRASQRHDSPVLWSYL